MTWLLKELKLRLTKPSLTGTGAELGNKRIFGGGKNIYLYFLYVDKVYSTDDYICIVNVKHDLYQASARKVSSRAL